MRILPGVALCLLLTACGQSGELYRPEDRPQQQRTTPQDIRGALERQDAAEPAAGASEGAAANNDD